MLKFPENPRNKDTFVHHNGSIFEYNENEQRWLATFGAVPTSTILEDLRLQMVSVAEGMCSTKIKSGFTSRALGYPGLYPASITDQMNYLAGSVDGANFWVSVEGAWRLLFHTADQALTVVSDFATYRSFCSSGLLKVRDLIYNTDSVEELHSLNLANFFEM